MNSSWTQSLFDHPCFNTYNIWTERENINIKKKYASRHTILLVRPRGHVIFCADSESVKPFKGAAVFDLFRLENADHENSVQ